MIFHEGRYEVVAVIVSGLAAEVQRDVGLRAGTLQKFRAKLFVEELIGIAIVDQEIGKPCAILDEGDGVVTAPRRPVIAEISTQRLDAPWHLRRRHDRRKGARRTITGGIPERDRERTMTAHRMA